MDVSDLARALWGTGMIIRGGFHPRAEDGVPTSAPAGTLIMIGNAGGAMWRAFTRSREFNERARRPAPLDEWTERVLRDVGEEMGFTVLFPFQGPPYHPFQQWAQRADAVSPSPVGPLIHPEFGLWHAYRGAFVTAARLDLPVPAHAPDPCSACDDKPCLSTCPVDAFGPDGYAVARCLSHLQTPEGEDCINLGCRARRACPVGTAYQYVPAQAAFHQGHFLRSSGLQDDPEPGF